MCLYARDLTADEGRRVQHEIRHGKDSVYMKRCQVVLCSAQGMTVQETAKLTLLSEYHIRELVRNFNEGGLDAMKPKKPDKPNPKFTEEEKASIAEFAQMPPRVLGYPFNSGQREISRNARRYIAWRNRHHAMPPAKRTKISGHIKPRLCGKCGVEILERH